MKNLIVSSYIVYLPLALMLTFVVARIFFKNSKIFMSDIFKGRMEIAASTNTMMQMGFYLLSLGYALFIMKITNYRETFELQDAFEILSSKMGALAVFMGVMVFAFLYLLFRGKRIARQNQIQNQNAQS
jgi:hypothetical protein